MHYQGRRVPQKQIRCPACGKWVLAKPSGRGREALYDTNEPHIPHSCRSRPPTKSARPVPRSRSDTESASSVAGLAKAWGIGPEQALAFLQDYDFPVWRPADRLTPTHITAAWQRWEQHKQRERYGVESPYYLLKPPARRCWIPDVKRLVVDGSNVAHGTDDEGPPKLANLLAMSAFLREHQCRPIIIVDAALRHRIDQGPELERLLQTGQILEAPPRTDADLTILNHARSKNLSIVSNYRFQDYAAEFPDEVARVVNFSIEDGVVSLYRRTRAAGFER